MILETYAETQAGGKNFADSFNSIVSEGKRK